MDYAEQEENVTNLRWRVNITSYQNKNVISILMVLVYVEKLTVRMSASGIMK